MEEEDERVGSSDDGRESPEEEEEELTDEIAVLKFLDSMDGYLTLVDSLSSTLRQGWLDIASARHSMGVSRVNSSLFDLNCHSAATSLQVTEDAVHSTMKQPQFALCKWASHDNQKQSSEEAMCGKDELLHKKPTSPQLRHRGTSNEDQEKIPQSSGEVPAADSQVLKERSKILSMFGTLVSPKLRGAQLSFETALEKLVELANMRSSILSAYDKLQKGMRST